jgi:hypothetical protein
MGLLLFTVTFFSQRLWAGGHRARSAAPNFICAAAFSSPQKFLQMQFKL